MDIPNKQHQPKVSGSQIRPPRRLLVLQCLNTMLKDLRIDIILVSNPLPCHLHTITTDHLDRTAISLKPITRLVIALPIPHSIGIHTRNPGRHILARHVPLSFFANYLVF